MYPISQATLDMLMSNNRQTALISFADGGTLRTITSADIVLGGLSIDRYCISGNKIEMGSAIASELTVMLDNSTGKWNGISFEGKELFVQIGVTDGTTTTYIPCGYFSVDTPPRMLEQITLKALDRMMLFEKKVNWDNIGYPITIENIVEACCTDCGVQVATTQQTVWVNATYSIQQAPKTTDITYRQLLMWCAEITGTCAYIDWDGRLRLEWYHDTTTEITPAERYSSDIYEDDVMLSGIQIVDADGNKYLSGTNGYIFNIEGNELIHSDYSALCTAIYNSSVNGFSYRPYTCTAMPHPHVYPLDTISYTDKNGTVHTTIVTNIKYVMNGLTTISGKGETLIYNGYSTVNRLTNSERVILSRMDKKTNDTIETKQQEVINLNAMVNGALGLHQIIVDNGDNGISYYYCNAATLAASSIIYAFNAGGFAWTNDWNDGNPVWNYGFTQNGNAVFKILDAYKIQATYLDADSVTADKIATDAVKSRTFVDNPNSHFSTNGTMINLEGSGYIKAKNFALDSAGNAFLKGVIEALNGKIGGWTIDSDSMSGSYDEVIARVTYTFTITLNKTNVSYERTGGGETTDGSASWPQIIHAANGYAGLLARVEALEAALGI